MVFPLILLGAVCAPTPQEYRLSLEDGRELSAASVAISSEQCSLGGSSVDAVALEDVIEISFPGSRSAKIDAGNAALHLHDGSFLVGDVRGGDDLFLQLEIAGGASVEMNVDAIRALILGEGASARFPEAYPKREGLDTLFRRRGDGRGDYTTGTFLEFGEEVFLFEYTLGEGKFPVSEIEALLLDQQVPLPEVEPGDRMVEADLWPDGTLRGLFEGLDPQHLKLTPIFGEEPVQIPRQLVRGLRFSGSHIWLSDLKPVEIREVPFFGGEELFLYPHRPDRSVTGGPLQVAGRRFGKGVGTHSQTALTYDLDGLSASRFLAEVGISDEVLELPNRGAVQFAVLVDGVERFRSATIRGGDPSVTVGPIELEGAAELTLVTDFAEGEDVSDRGVWGRAILLR